MEQPQALKTLRLDATADGRTVESAYWNLVHRAQARAAEQDPAAEAEIEALNDAYGTLVPGGRVATPPKQRIVVQEQGTGIAVIDWFVDWVSAEALRTRLRWPHRNPEIALIGGGALVLMLLALGAGASLSATFLATGIVCAAIWAPWRKPE
jgi:hypothetical protein